MPTVKLAVRYLDTANHVAHRQDLGDITELTNEIKLHGIKKPLLVRPDFLLIDGFRRLEAARALGMTEVPIQMIKTWGDLLTHFKPVEQDCLPMNWMDLADFWVNVLQPIHQDHRYVTAVLTRKSGAAYIRTNYSGFITALANLYDSPPATVKLMRDYLVRLKRNKRRFPEFYDGVTRAFPNGEAARNLTACRVLKAVFEKLLFSNEVTETEAVMLFQQRLEDALSSERPRVPRAVAPLNPKQPPTPLTQVKNLAQLLAQVGAQASQFRNFKFSPQDAGEVLDSMSDSLAEIYELRKRLNGVYRGKVPAPRQRPSRTGKNQNR